MVREYVKLDTVLRAIRAGALDEQLNVIDRALRERKEYLKQRHIMNLKLTLEPGQRVRVADTVRPVKLRHATARYISPHAGRAGVKVLVELEHPLEQRSGYVLRHVILPLSQLEVLP